MDKDIQPAQLDYEHVELILKEASAYSLRWEVKKSAVKYIAEGHPYVESFQMAYHDWVK